jgi:long-subunit fatty acid transport protein
VNPTLVPLARCPRPARPAALRVTALWAALTTSVSTSLLASVLASVLASSLASSPAQAIGAAELYGHDVRSMGKANAVMADDTGAAAAFVNPAALARVRSPQIHTNFQLSLPAVSIELDDPDVDPALRPALPPPVAGNAFGFAAPIELVIPDRLFFGVTAYFPASVAVRARSFDPARPSFYLYDAATEHYEVFAAVALRIIDGVAVGVGARLGAAQGGSTTIALDPVRGRFVRQEIDTSQSNVPSPTAGVLIGPFGVPAVRARAAFAFREASSFDVTLPASLEITGLDIGLLLDIVNRANYSPRMWTGGVTVEVLEHTQVSFDAQYAEWSAAPAPFLQVANDVQGEGLDRLGLGTAIDAPAPGENRVVSPGFVDTWNLRAGVETRLLDERLLLRGGYGWRPTPVPDQTSGTNIVDNDTHTFAVGAGVRFLAPVIARNPLELNASYQAGVFSPRRAEKASGRDPVGSWTAAGAVHHVGLDLRYAW